MSYEIKGELFCKSEIIQVTDKFKKREFVIEISGQYPEYIKMQIINDKCALIDNVNIGQTINVSFNLKGKGSKNNQGETIYYNNLDAWKIEKVGSETAPPPQTKSKAFAPPPPVEQMESTEDLPF